MKIGARVLITEAWRLPKGEQAALKRIFRFTKKTRVMVSFTDQPPADVIRHQPYSQGAAYEFRHETAYDALGGNHCAKSEGPGVCTCKTPEFGDDPTVLFARAPVGRVVALRFVPRPLTLSDAVLYDEVDLSVLAVEASWLMDRGYAIGGVIARMIYEARKADAA